MSAIFPTSLPWQAMHDFDVEGRTTIIGNVDGEIHSDGGTTYTYDFVASTLDPDDDSQSRSVAVANADFIVRACNSHADLLEASKRALTALVGVDKLLHDHGMMQGVECPAIPILRAAIAKARGQ